MTAAAGSNSKKGVFRQTLFTVFDNAAQEVCPVWPGQPITAYWGIPDPACVEGTEAERRFAFADAYRMLRQRITIFVNLPIHSLGSLALKNEVDEIGKLSRVVREEA